ncbi:unnamed protein product [Rotaria sp. Silwood1]|nr:unnamed protein product [Rotaria sp. Silwood1]
MWIYQNLQTIVAVRSLACSPTGRGISLSLSDSTPSSWTQYQFTYTAATTLAVLLFGFQNENNRKYYLDTASVVDNSASTTQLLKNPGFESSTTTLTDWVQYCTSTCGSGSTPGTISTGSNCYLSTGSCYVDNCYASAGIDFLSQTFTATVGHTYTVSFRLVLGGSGTTTANRFYADVVSI